MPVEEVKNAWAERYLEGEAYFRDFNSKTHFLVQTDTNYPLLPIIKRVSNAYFAYFQMLKIHQLFLGANQLCGGAG
jgi:hypothetical protein